MNPLKTTIFAATIICGLFTALLVYNESNRPPLPENDLIAAEKVAVHIANELNDNVEQLNESLKSLSYNTFWQSSAVGEWGFWLNSQKALYQAAGFSLLGVHSVSNDVLSFEKPLRPGNFLELTQPLERLYKDNKVITLLQLFRDTPAIVSLAPIKDIENNIIGALVAVQYLDDEVLKHYHHLARVPVAIINNDKIRAISISNTIDITGYNLVEIQWPETINSSLWKMALLTTPQGPVSTAFIYLAIGILLTIILMVICLKQFSAVKNDSKRLKKCLDVQKPITEQINQLTSLQNTTHDPIFVDLIQAINMRFSQLVHQQKALNIRIAEHKKVEKSLKHLRDSLSNERDSAIALPRLKSEFLSRMGDEITTPMKSVVGMLKLLSEFQLETEAKQILQIAKRSTRTLVDNLNNILDFSKLDAKMLKLVPSKFSVRELIDDLASELSHYANEKDLSLQASSDPELPSELTADKGRIRQILRNLLGNAIRFTKSGEVSLYADLMTQDDKQLLRFTVTDTGVGIPAEAQKGLFDSLEQSTKLTNSSFAGRLRLIVSKDLAELMGGSIGVISETGKGSQFWFTIEI